MNVYAHHVVNMSGEWTTWSAAACYQWCDIWLTAVVDVEGKL